MTIGDYVAHSNTSSQHHHAHTATAWSGVGTAPSSALFSRCREDEVTYPAHNEQGANPISNVATHQAGTLLSSRAAAAPAQGKFRFRRQVARPRLSAEAISSAYAQLRVTSQSISTHLPGQSSTYRRTTCPELRPETGTTMAATLTFFRPEYRTESGRNSSSFLPRASASPLICTTCQGAASEAAIIAGYQTPDEQTTVTIPCPSRSPIATVFALAKPPLRSGRQNSRAPRWRLRRYYC